MSSEARIFLTDYASYNEGTQFEFGHWVDLSNFSDEEELRIYMDEHFEKCDKKRPLFCGTPREEIMITDYEGFPENLYSESSMNYEKVFEWLNMEEHEREALNVALEIFCTYEEAFEQRKNLCYFSYENSSDVYSIFEQLYPDAEAQERQNPYLTIDYDSFIRHECTEVTTEEGRYLVIN